MKEEIWKDIEGYEGLYQVSNFGSVKRLESIVSATSKKGNEFKIIVPKKILKNRLCCGYYIVGLCKDSKSKNYRVNRLVAKAFIPNPNNYPCVNHKDGNKLNNDVDNLEWCTYSYNNKEAYRLGLKKPTWTGRCYDKHPTNQKVIQLDLDDKEIKLWNSIQQAQDYLKINNISAVCRKKQKTAGGYKWKYYEEKNNFEGEDYNGNI